MFTADFILSRFDMMLETMENVYLPESASKLFGSCTELLLLAEYSDLFNSSQLRSMRDKLNDTYRKVISFLVRSKNDG